MIKNFPILQGRVYIIELLEDNRKVWLTPPDSMGQMAVAIDLVTTSFHYLPAGNWQILGRLSEITESEADELVEWVETGQYYVDYRVDGWWNGDITALESLESSILAEGYSFTNPLGNEKEYKKKYKGHPMVFANHMAKWFEAQSRVLDRSRCLLLRRMDG